MFENHGAYICARPSGSYFTNADRPANPSVYRFHFISAGSDPYTTTYALLRSPKSFFTVNPIFSNSDDITSPIDLRTGSSFLIKYVTVTGFPRYIHLSPIFSAPCC